MRFTIDEFLVAGSHKWKLSEIDDVTVRNMIDLCEKVNALGFRDPRFLSSCLRSIEDQKRINPKSMGSSHLYGCALDVVDKDGKLALWVKNNVEQLKEVGLWCESLEHTKGWVHFQTIRPKSGNRFFIP